MMSPRLRSPRKNTVLADWLFIATSGVVQPATGFLMVYWAGYDPFAGWLVATYLLYLIAAACWAKVVGLQLGMRRLAAEALSDGDPLPSAYHDAMRRWFILGWPAFLALLAVFVLMVFKPAFG